jgi:hypothetical protein
MKRLITLAGVMFMLLAFIGCDKTPTESKTEKIYSPVKLIVKGRIDYPDENGKIISIDTKGKEQEVILPEKYWGKKLNKSTSTCNTDYPITIIDMGSGYILVTGGSYVEFVGGNAFVCDDPEVGIWRIEPQMYLTGAAGYPTYKQRAKGGFLNGSCQWSVIYSPWTNKSSAPLGWINGDWSAWFGWEHIADECNDGDIWSPTVFVDMTSESSYDEIRINLIRLHIWGMP